MIQIFFALLLVLLFTYPTEVMLKNTALVNTEKCYNDFQKIWYYVYFDDLVRTQSCKKSGCLSSVNTSLINLKIHTNDFHNISMKF